MHDEAIAINQDPLGKSAVRIDGARRWSALLQGHRLPMDPLTWANGETLAKPLANGDWAVLLFNRLNTTIDITLAFGDVGNTSQLCWHVRDIWGRADLGRRSGEFVASGVPPHGNRFLRLSNGEVCTPTAPTCDGEEPLNVSSGSGVHYTMHPQRGWYGEGGQQLVGEKGAMSVAACAEACTARGAGQCGAFHVYFDPRTSCHRGDCYVHALPRGAFVPGNANAFAYVKQQQR